VATTRDLLAISTSNLLSRKMVIRRIFEQKIKAIKISVFEKKLTSKEKAIFFVV